MLQAETIELETTGASAQAETLPKQASSLQKVLLSLSLHNSLDLEQIIREFAEALAQQIPCASITYRYPTDAININLGIEQAHYYNYHLSLDQQALGDIKFTREERFTTEEVKQIEDYLRILLPPLRNALRYLQALKSAQQDPLTGLGNRAAFSKAMRREVEMAKRHDWPLTILALDLDHFKSVNDQYGHPGGDQLLKAVSACMGKCIRETDLLFRTGGEEFHVILTKTNREGAALLANRIRESIAKMKCQYKGQTIRCTVSIGIGEYIDDISKQTLIEHADEALYRAKHEGRNKVCL